MRPYLFYVGRDGSEVADLHIVMCGDDEAARIKAAALLAERASRRRVEVCEGERTVTVLERAALIGQGL